jgi:hypothetical protein
MEKTNTQKTGLRKIFAGRYDFKNLITETSVKTEVTQDKVQWPISVNAGMILRDPKPYAVY